MADDLKNSGPQDRSRVNMTEDWEVQWWCQKWGITAAQLKEAVAKVGPMADKIARYFNKPL